MNLPSWDIRSVHGGGQSPAAAEEQGMHLVGGLGCNSVLMLLPVTGAWLS